MEGRRRIATARPPPGGAAQTTCEGTELGPRAREFVHALLDGFKEHDLLTYASAISFQILTAIVPFLLSVMALAGALHLESVWQQHLEPVLRQHFSAPIFAVIRGAVDSTFRSRRLLWITLGSGLTLWQVSGAVRAVMGALSRIYGSPGERPFFKRYVISFALSIEAGVCFVGAALCLGFAPFVERAHPGALWLVFAFVVRWALALGLLFFFVGLLVRHAPSQRQPLPWVSVGATIVIACWVIASSLFYFYITDVASYRSVFGGLAVLIVAMAYLYISTMVFLFGAQLDAIVRAQATGTLHGHEPAFEPDGQPLPA